jgi:hypothetical protein
MNCPFLADRERRAGADRGQQHIDLLEEPPEGGPEALALGRGGEVAGEVTRGRKLEAAADVGAVLVAAGGEEPGLGMREERLRWITPNVS